VAWTFWKKEPFYGFKIQKKGMSATEIVILEALKN
jgi:hypothetical protein